MADLFDSIREGFKFVAENARHVRIDHARLQSYAAELPAQSPRNVLSPAHHYAGDPEGTAAYILALDAINFGSGYKPYLAAEGWRLVEGSIYYTVSTRLKNHFEKIGPFTAARLCALNPADIAAILELDMKGENSAVFATLCAQSLNDLGMEIEKSGGSFFSYAAAAEGRAENLVRALLRMRHFRDENSYNGRTIGFYKRAQIAVADLHLAFRAAGKPLFHDLHRLTMFADNAVPHVLRTDGVLVYTPELAARIDAGQEIPAGSAEETEIRACACHAAELIAAAKNMNAMDIDHILWHRSAEDSRYRNGKSHRTRTVFY